jgi:hypothetical protein
MGVTLVQKGKATVQVLTFEKKVTPVSKKPYVELKWCGLRVRAAREASFGVIYQICGENLVRAHGHRGDFVEFKWRKKYDMAQKFEDLFFDFFEDNPEAGKETMTISYSCSQWMQKQKLGEMLGWQDYFLPPTMM